MYEDAPRELAVAYARFIDDRSFDRLAEIMIEDVQVSSPLFACKSLAEFCEQLQLLNNYRVTMHMVGNTFGSWEEGCYTGEAYCMATHIYEVDGQEWKWEVGIRYEDRIIIRDRQPLFSHRHLNVLWQQDQPLITPGGWHGG